MFDGSYRSRREINLSGGRRRAATSTTGKQSTLQIAKEQRELRRIQALQNSSAECIQRHVLGYSGRKRVGLVLAERRGLGRHSLHQQMSILAVRLSPVLLPFWPATNGLTKAEDVNGKRSSNDWVIVHRKMLGAGSVWFKYDKARAVLQKMAREYEQQSATLPLYATSQQQQQQQAFVFTRIACAALHLLCTWSRPSDDDAAYLAQFVRRLCEVDSTKITLRNVYWRDQTIDGDATNTGILVTCLQIWLGKCSALLDSVVIRETTLSVSKTLLDVAFLGCATTESSAHLAAALATTASLRAHPLYDYVGSKAKELCPTISNVPFWIDLFQHLSVSLAGENRKDENSKFTSFIDSLVVGSEVTILTNALQLVWDQSTQVHGSHLHTVLVSTMVLLIQYTLTRVPELTYLSSLVGLRGSDDSILQYFSDQGQMQTRPTIAEDSMDGVQSISSDDENDEDGDDSFRSPPAFLRGAQSQQVVQMVTSSTSLLNSKAPSRAEFSTLKALDSSHKRYIRKQRSIVCASVASSTPREKEELKNLACLFGREDFLVDLGTSIFAAAPQEQRTKLKHVQNMFSHILYQVLSDSGGIRTNSSPLLSKLAFSSNFTIVRGLWNIMLDNSLSYSAESASVFCDVFSHALLAVDDDEFTNVFSNESKRVSPLGLVQYLNRELYDLYWTHPVLASGMSDPAEEGRFRLLLSGTKLFNSLYERWCRMDSTARFCSEDAWWWPRLVLPNGTAGSGGRSDVVIASRPGGGGNSIISLRDDDEEDEMERGSDDDIHMDDVSPQQQQEEGDDATLANVFRDPKLARVLAACPQALPFYQRVQMFHSLLEADKRTTQDEERALRLLMMQGQLMHDDRIHVRVRRDDLYTDSLRQLNALGKRLRERVQVTMINRHGTEESGIDGGGVFKEFLDDLIREAFNPSQGGLFAVSPVETLFVNPAAASSHQNEAYKMGVDLLQQYEFLGRVLGKAVYESILVEPQFSLPFLNLILGKQNTLDDLKTFDPEMYRHLSSLRKMSNASDLGLTFEVTSAFNRRGQFVTDEFSATSVPLCQNGEHISVTKGNVIQYVHLLAHHKLNVEGSIQSRAFLRGFRDLIPAPWVRLFSSAELQKLISGDDAVKGIDVEDMQRSMQYAGGYHPSQPIIIWFWEVLAEMSAEQQRKFLKFMTSCSRQPLLGFQALIPLPCIQQVQLDENGKKLPTSSTCMNLLKLPKYESKETLREKLLYAIEAGAGFELT